MTITAIRQKLHKFLEIADSKKVKAIYTLFENEIEQDEMEYTAVFKKELERRYAKYTSGTAIISSAEVEKQVKKSLQTAKGK